ncbi:MAG: ribonuclease HII [Ruminococcus sp.]|nr:ribonuclease HII [Ruminococcus sp.]
MKKDAVPVDWLKYENELREQGYKYICGVDEAGRGPLAGPVCAAAVILPPDTIIEGVNDSKKLSEKKREELFDIVIDTALAYCIAFGSVEEIEEHNILATTMMTMKRAVEGLSVKADYAIVDGNKLPPLDIDSKYIIKGDANSMSIAAASILAKVSRDRLMLEYAKEYPQYCFEKHKGYDTKLHNEMIPLHGPSPIHRMSFLKKLLNKK